MKFEIGDKVIWRSDGTDRGVIENVNETLISVRWQRAGLLTHSEPFWHVLTLVEKSETDFSVTEFVKVEDFTGTVVVYKGRKYKLTLVQ